MTLKNVLIFLKIFLLTTSVVSAADTPSQELPILDQTVTIEPSLETSSSENLLAQTPSPPDLDSVSKELYANVVEIETPSYRKLHSDVVMYNNTEKKKAQDALVILGEEVLPGEKRVLSWSIGQSFSGRSIDPPVLISHGKKAGTTLCLTAAIHGDELNGIELVRRVIGDLDPEDMSGTVIGVPIVNIYGFSSNSRYLPDRRDLNRYFPGREHGSSASRIAYLFFNQIIKHCDQLVDIHTASFKRNNLPQLRADLNNPQVRDFTRYFGSTTVLHKTGIRGTLRGAATSSGIPTVTFEIGQPAILQPELVDFGVKAIETLMDKLGIIQKLRLWSEPQPIYYGSRWVRADKGGILSSTVKLGQLVKEGDLLGYIINPLSSDRTEIIAPEDGRILGMALNQFMLPGYAAFNIGIVSSSTSKRHVRQKTEKGDTHEPATYLPNETEELEPFEQDEEYD